MRAPSYPRLAQSSPFPPRLGLYPGTIQLTPVVDDQVAIQGNGNQDTQSWFHSQEINLLLDSPLICREWRDAIDSNQNTKFYGLVDETGTWRDEEGHELSGAEQSEIPHGPMKSLVGVKGAIQRVRGEGGF